MSTLRFAMLAVTVFVASYFAVGWFLQHAVVPIPVVREPAPDARLTTFAEARARAKRGPPHVIHPTDDDPQRNAVRQAALRAATGFNLSPCDAGMRAAAIRDITAYAQMVADVSGCGRFMCGGEAKVDAADQLFSTALDERVKDQIAEAFNAGLRHDEFPSSLRLSMLILSKQNAGGTSPCGRARSPDR